MGMYRLIVEGREFRYYDNGELVITTVGEQAIIIGTIPDEGTDDLIVGRMRAMAISWLRTEHSVQEP